MKRVKESVGEKTFKYVNVILIIIITLIMLYPLWYELNLSLSSMSGSMRGGMFLIPMGFSIGAYKEVLNTAYIWTTFGNSIFVTVVGTVLSVFLTACTAYPLTKNDVPGRNIFVKLIIFTMLFSGGMIPTFMVVKDLHLINHLWALILPGMISAYNVIIAISFFKSIPVELEESAYIDGANPIYIFFKIILPLSKPILATLSIWVAVGLWNDFFSALIYLNDSAKFTLPIMLRNVIDGQLFAVQSGEFARSSSQAVIAATVVISVIPILCVYPFFQRFFIKGVMIGSVKG